MLLQWVLTRDEGVVLNMLEDFESHEPSQGGELVRTNAATWQSVGANYGNSGEVELREEEIYTALRSGKLRSWISRNQSGNLILADRDGWGHRTFFSYRGHDLAVPLNGYPGYPNETFQK